MAVAWREHEALHRSIVADTQAIEVGGGVARFVLPPERVDFLDERADFVFSLENLLPSSDKQTKWQRILADAIRHGRTEYRNSDLKVVDSSLLDHHQYQHEGEPIEVLRGNTTVNPHMAEMVTFTIHRSNGTTKNIRISPIDFPGDRRSGPNVTRLQQVVRTPDEKLFDRATGRVIDARGIQDIIEQLPESFFERQSTELNTDTLLTQFGRFVLNNVRWYGHINDNQSLEYKAGAKYWVRPDGYYLPPDPDKDYYTRNIRTLVECALNSVGYVREVTPTMSEFRSRMIASFLISPRLFLDISRAYGSYILFPNLSTQRSSRFYERVDYFNHVDVLELEHIVRSEVMGEYYREEDGLAANLGRIFAYFPIEADGCIEYNN